MITKQEKTELTKQFGKNEKDTGSPEVQVALLTRRITNLTPHFAAHKQDHNSKRGLMKLIGKRKAILKHLAVTNETRYQNLIQELGLRK